MIPAPPFSSFNIGPLTVQIYGVIMALAIAAGYYVAFKQKEKYTITEQQLDFFAITTIITAIVSARLYHVVTNWQLYQNNLLQVVQIWNGGIGILGALLGGSLAAFYCAKRLHKPLLLLTDLLVQSLALGQSIGRLGNYFNQELYGTPTKAFWGLYVTPDRRPSEYSAASTFHPTFLYELILNFLNFVLLTYLARKYRLKVGVTTGCYLLFYGIIRFLLEIFRYNNDTNAIFLGVKTAQLLALLLIIVGASIIVISSKKQTPQSFQG